ncbi:FecR domain-containing protein [Methylocystis sp. IM3]|uniref:FecR family protein n=1 Tax=unclassified Methylocystis TaxID=2625913 RepID=UPI0030F7905F
MLKKFPNTLLFAGVASAAVTMACGAWAYDNIGVASYVRNDVNGVLPSRTALINVGEGIVRDEIIKTVADSAAKVVFTDSTNLSIGPNSVVKLDKFVFSGDSSYQKATINLAKGALRFATGTSDKHAYEIKSPVATIGVRGTIFEFSYTGTGRREKTEERCEARGGERDKKCKPKCADIGAGQSATIEGREGKSTINVLEGVVHVCSLNVAQYGSPNQMIDCGGAMCTRETFTEVQQQFGQAPGEGLGSILAPAAALGAIGGGIGGGLAGQDHGSLPPPFFNSGSPASADGSRPPPPRTGE